MKKTLKIQSIVDVITNSSSEIFIIRRRDDNQKDISTEDLLNNVMDNIVGMTEDYIKHYKEAYPNSLTDSVNDVLYAYIADTYESDNSYDYVVSPGDLVVRSADDNSIPYPLMEYIEDIAYGFGVNIQRRHLG